MDDRLLEKLIKIIDKDTIPPEGLKEKLLAGIIVLKCSTDQVLTPFEKFIFEKPLRTACAVSIFVSGLLWAFMDGDLVNLLNGIIG